MKSANTLLAIAIVATQLVAVGSAATSASAQETGSQQARRQQRLILQQQRIIEQNQRRLEAQEQRLGRPARAAAGAPEPINRGIFGNIGNCPVGWTYSLFSGCLPAVVVIH